MLDLQKIAEEAYRNELEKIAISSKTLRSAGIEASKKIFSSPESVKIQTKALEDVYASKGHAGLRASVKGQLKTLRLARGSAEARSKGPDEMKRQRREMFRTAFKSKI